MLRPNGKAGIGGTNDPRAVGRHTCLPFVTGSMCPGFSGDSGKGSGSVGVGSGFVNGRCEHSPESRLGTLRGGGRRDFAINVMSKAVGVVPPPGLRTGVAPNVVTVAAVMLVASTFWRNRQP